MSALSGWLGRRGAKYGNVRVDAGDEGTFASKREFRRWQELQLLARAGEIEALRRQVVYPLLVNEQLVGRYTADFVYVDRATGAIVVEDAKGVKTTDYKLRKKLMRAIYGIEIQEV